MQEVGRLSLTNSGKSDEVTSLNTARVLRAAGCPARRVAHIQPLGGGCISATAAWRLDDGSEIFVKSDDAGRLPMLQAEAAGLDALSATQTIRVPQVLAIGTDEDSRQAFLVSEHIRTATPPSDTSDPQSPAHSDFFTRFGQQLALLHRTDTSAHDFGWPTDNFIGATAQPNRPDKSWASFFASQRLEPQLRLARQQQFASPRLIRDVERLIGQLDSLLAGRNEPPALIHGDLWSGNYLCDEQQQPVLIDPAVYRADREAEFGMIELFGSCPRRFYQAYQDTYPLAAGWQQRTQLYVLYHLLNHLNLFGGGYLQQCESLAQRIG